MRENPTIGELNPPPAAPAEETAAVLADLRARLERDRPHNIGFPGAVDFDVIELLPFFRHLLNNVGDPFVDGVATAHTKELERHVVGFLADLFRAPPADRWGYVTSGGTDGNEYGLYAARSLHPTGIVYHSQAAHYSITKLVDRLRMSAVVVRARPDGEMDYRDLRAALRQHRDRPAIVVATVGTTMTEAIDDVAAIRQALGAVCIRDAFVHADAALAGIPLALVARDQRPGFDLADGADCVAVSGHKFVGSPFPCGVVLTRRSVHERVGRSVDYIGSIDSTIGGSRSGHAPLLLWYALRRHGIGGLRARAEASRALAEYAVARLNEIGWPAWRHPLAFTVVLPTPPAQVAARWMLASSGGTSHVICMPGVTQAQIEHFLSDLRASLVAANSSEVVRGLAAAGDARAPTDQPPAHTGDGATSGLPGVGTVALRSSVTPRG